MKMWPQTDQLKFHNEKFTIFTIQKLVQIYATNMCTQKKTYSHDRISTYERCHIKSHIHCHLTKIKKFKKDITRDFQVCRSRMGKNKHSNFIYYGPYPVIQIQSDHILLWTIYLQALFTFDYVNQYLTITIR